MTPAAPPAGWTPGRTDTRLVQSASAAPRSYDRNTRTVEAVLATSFRVRRWFGWEELAITPEAIDLKRVGLGQCRLLDSHNQFDTKATLGNIIAARVERGELIGKIRFADSAAGRDAERQASSGEVTGLSVGYKITRLVRIGEADGDEVYRAEAWELLEASLVTVPADPYAACAASLRSLCARVPASPASTPPVSDGHGSAPYRARHGWQGVGVPWVLPGRRCLRVRAAAVFR